MNTDLNPGSFLDNFDLKRLGERLQLARKTKGLTQDAVATQLNVARTTLVAIEKGERRITEPELIFLADLYDKNIFDFVNPHAPNADMAVQFRSLLQKKLFPDDELNRFAIWDHGSELMKSEEPFIRELACLHGVDEERRHAVVLDSAFDRDEQLAFDAINQLQPSSYF